MRLSIQFPLRDISSSNTVSIPENSVSNGSDRRSITGHTKPVYCRQMANSRITLQSTKTVIQLTGLWYWLYAAVDSETNGFRHARLCPTRTIAPTEMFLSKLTEKHDVEDTVFLVDSAPWLEAALYPHGRRFRYETHANRNAIERLPEEIKRCSYQFGNCFRNVPTTRLPATKQSRVPSRRSSSVR